MGSTAAGTCKRAVFVALLLWFLVGAGASTSVAAPATLGPNPNDSAFPLQWNLQAIGAPAAWATGTGEGTTIAIIDSGIDLQHPDLQDKIVGHVDCLGTNGDESKCTDGGIDDNGHGTHVAGIAAADTNNGRGVAGVAPDAALLSIKVLTQACGSSNCDATGTASDVAAGIMYAADHGATVINMSLGNTTQSVLGPAFSQAIEYAWSKGVVSVIAAGNNVVLPSGFGSQPVIVVGALDRNGDKASYGSDIGNAHWGLMAPGGEAETGNTAAAQQQSCATSPQGVLSTYLNDSYACLAGTSMAAPHVAGAAAILRGLGFSPLDTVNRLLSTARPIGPSSVDGAGALDLAAAVSGSPPPTTQQVSAAGAPPPSSVAAPTPSGDGGSNANEVPVPAPVTTTPAVPLPGGVPAVAAPPLAITTRDDNGLPAGPVAVATVMAGTVLGASGWILLRNLAQTRSLSKASR